VNKKQIVYNKVFGSEYGKEVLADLRAICYPTKRLSDGARDNEGKLDTSQILIHEGRREVFLHIIDTMKINFEEVYNYNLEDY